MNFDCWFDYDESGSPVAMTFQMGTTITNYYYIKNLQGDVIALAKDDGTIYARYSYDAWGNIISIKNKDGVNITELSAADPAIANPFRYHSYFYDDFAKLYQLQSRYYDPGTGRFVNADGEISGNGGDIRGCNMFSYCFNNPVNMDDYSGNWPKWLTGAINVVSGALQVAAGAALGATVGWTGIGAIAAGILVVNGASTIAQGIGQIVNDVSNSNIMPEENLARTGVQSIGKAVGGKKGAKVAGGVYDATVFAAGIYAGVVGLQQAAVIPTKVPIKSIIADPTNPMTDEGINYWTRTLAQNGFKGYNTLPNAYGMIEPITVSRSTMMIQNGHHRVAVLAKYGVENIKVFLK